MRKRGRALRPPAINDTLREDCTKFGQGGFISGGDGGSQMGSEGAGGEDTLVIGGRAIMIVAKDEGEGDEGALSDNINGILDQWMKHLDALTCLQCQQMQCPRAMAEPYLTCGLKDSISNSRMDSNSLGARNSTTPNPVTAALLTSSLASETAVWSRCLMAVLLEVAE